MTRQRVVVVEDDGATRDALRSLFRRMGFRVEAAPTIFDGFSLLDPPPDYLVLDLMMPDGDGADLLRFVRRAGMPTHVTVTTGVGDPQRLDAVTGLKPDALLTKPIAIDEV